MPVIEQMLARYPQQTSDDLAHAWREVMQEVALAGLNRGGFFQHAAFYGGTCLRIFHGLPRFSEDLDFSLLSPRPDFSLQPFFNALRDEFAALGVQVDITEKEKTADTAIASAFLKPQTAVYDVRVAGQKALKIKFEVDTDPPLGFATEDVLLLQPYSCYVRCFTLPDLFAGKMHALLFRRWKNRVKGRDWYDFEWYVRQGVRLNLAHLAERARQSGDWSGDALTPTVFHELLTARIHSLDVGSARADVIRFIRDEQSLAIWSADYFQQLAKRIAL